MNEKESIYNDWKEMTVKNNSVDVNKSKGSQVNMIKE